MQCAVFITLFSLLVKVTTEVLVSEDVEDLIKSFVDVENGKEYKSTLLEIMDFDEEESEWSNELPYLHTNEFHMDDQIFIPQHSNDTEKRIRFRSEYPQSSRRKAKRTVLTEYYMWPGGIIPWKFNDGNRKFSSSENEKRVLDAIHHMESNTCLKFPRIGTPNIAKYNIDHDNFLDIGTGSGCGAVVGYSHSGPQEIYLKERSCMKFGTIVHELAHSVGLIHEHSRTDRDRNIKVNFNNVRDRKEENFMIKSMTRNLAEYDLASDMHYGSRFFSKNGQNTINSLDPRLQFLIGKRRGLSFYDIKTLTRAYRCGESCPMHRVCENSGFVNHECRCHCPKGLAGETCTIIDRDLAPDCGEYIVLDTNKELKITSPGYPEPYLQQRCVWLVRGPGSTKMSVTLSVLGLAHDLDTHTCQHWIEVRYHLMGQDGPKYCGKSAVEEKFQTDSNLLLLIFDASLIGRSEDGFVATITTESTACPEDLCDNGGTCSPGVKRRFVCVCPVGYSGDSCEYLDGPVTCPFDSFSDVFLCLLQQVLTDNFDWKQFRGHTASDGTGPTSDASGKGAYLFVESSPPREEGDVASLISKSIAGGVRCISLHYHMYGADMGTLRVRFHSDRSEDILWEITGNQGNQWHQIQFAVYSVHNFTFTIDGIVGKSWLSDMAIDSLSLSPHYCISPDVTITLSQMMDAEEFICNFDDHMCHFQSLSPTGLEWTRILQETGNFVRLKVEEKQTLFPVVLSSLPFLHKRHSCLSFWIRAIVKGKGNFKVSVQDINRKHNIVVWQVVNDVEVLKWKEIMLHLAIGEIYKVTFAVSSQGPLIAVYDLTNIRVSPGKCFSATAHIPFKCDFESDNACGFQKALGADLPWNLVYKGKLHGPMRDHTNGRGKFLVVESLDKNPGHRASMISPYFMTVGRACLHFFFHAVGQTLGRFSVFTVSQTGMKEQWSLKDKFQEIFWSEVRLPIEEAEKFQESI